LNRWETDVFQNSIVKKPFYKWELISPSPMKNLKFKLNLRNSDTINQKFKAGHAQVLLLLINVAI
jgi:hypothetical protein